MIQYEIGMCVLCLKYTNAYGQRQSIAFVLQNSFKTGVLAQLKKEKKMVFGGLSV